MSSSSAWDALASEICQWFHDPDLEAFRISLCALASHFYRSEHPVWLLVIGDSGSGKTELLASASAGLPESWLIGAISPKAFLSGWQSGKHSMLYTMAVARPGPDGLPRHTGIWIAKDFTTLFSIRPDLRSDIFASLREIWDGRFTRNVGVDKALEWSGKITLLACATPEVESHWSSVRGLGERFLGLRWRSPIDRFAAMEKARCQLGREAEMTAAIRARTLDYLSPILHGGASAVDTPSDPSVLAELDGLADLVALLRVHIPRSSEHGRGILRIPEPEFPIRLSTAFYQIARTHAALSGRSSVNSEDLALSRRLAVDGIPRHRARILSLIPHSGSTVDYGVLLKSSSVPKTSLIRELENLLALGVLVEGQGWTNEWTLQSAGLSFDFRRRLARAGLKLDQTPGPVAIRPVLQQSG